MNVSRLGAIGLAIASLSFAAYGCGGSTTGGTAAPVPRDQFVDAAVRAVCDNVSGCCTSSGYTYSRAACVSALQPVYSTIAGDTSVGYDANAAGACIQALARSASSCRDQTGNGAACDHVFVGSTPAGAPCTSDTQCAAPAGGTASCSWSGGSSVCVVDSRGKAGDGCQATCTDMSGGGSTCSGGGGGASGTQGTATCYTNDGLYCSGSYVCTPLGQIGQSCDTDGCVAEAYCNGGTCVARVPAGQPCPNYDGCVASAYCNGSGTCASKQADGAPCQSSEECASGHCEGTCMADTIASSYLCTGGAPAPQPGGGSGGAATGGGGAPAP